MPPLAVDPETLSAAGSAVVAAGDGLNAAMAVLTAGFGANTGLDAAGTVFGLAYQSAAESLLKVAAAAVNACRYNGALIQLSASNYSGAEAASTLGGGASVLEPPGQPVKVAAPGPPGTLGPGEPPPLRWALVQSFVDDVWPNGDVAALHAAAGCWRSFGATVSGMQGALSASKTLVATQQIAEGERMNQVLSKIVTGIAGFGQQCGKMAASLDDFANEVACAQNAIRDLLHRLGSLCDLWHDVVSIFDGDAIDEIKKIAEDINAVNHNLGREARAMEQSMKLGMQVIDGLVVGMEKDMRGTFTHFLGDEVGNPVATVFDTWVNANEGVLKDVVGMAQGMVDLDPRWFLFDPKGASATWTAMAKTGLINDFLNPQEAGQANIQMFKSLLHLEDWRSDRPGLGAAENIFDVATLFLPGVGEAGAGVKGARAAARGAEVSGEAADAAGTVGRSGTAAGELGDLAGAGSALGDIGRAGGGLTKDFEGLTGDLPKSDPQLGGRPVGAPPQKPLEAPVEPAPRPPESAPPGTPLPESPTAPDKAAPGRPDAAVGPHELTPTPAGGPNEPASVPAASPHEPVSVPAAGSQRVPAPVATGERVPSTMPQLAEHSPARVPVSPSGSLVEPVPAAVHSPQSAAALTSAMPNASAPHFTLPGGRPPELPAPGSGGWHGPGDGGPPGGRPHGAPTHDRGLHEPGDGGPPRGGGPYHPGDGGSSPHPSGDGSPSEDGNHQGGDGTPGGTLDGTEGIDGQPIPAKIPGVDYSLPAADALRLLERPGAELERLGDGGVPHNILEGYEPLAGRSVEEFKREFTIQGSSGEIWWDWDVQAPRRGFAGEPLESTHIPAELRLDRLGPNAGGFLSPEGTHLAERATPPGLATQYHLFEGTGREIPTGKDWVVQCGPAKDAFGQPGGGEQWVVIDRTPGIKNEVVSVEDLIDARMLREIRPLK